MGECKEAELPKPDKDTQTGTSLSDVDRWEWPLGVNVGIDHWAWLLRLTVGSDHWEWPLGVTIGRDCWDWPLGVIVGSDQWEWPLEVIVWLTLEVIVVGDLESDRWEWMLGVTIESDCWEWLLGVTVGSDRWKCSFGWPRKWSLGVTLEVIAGSDHGWTEGHKLLSSWKIIQVEPDLSVGQKLFPVKDLCKSFEGLKIR